MYYRYSRGSIAVSSFNNCYVATQASYSSSLYVHDVSGAGNETAYYAMRASIITEHNNTMAVASGGVLHYCFGGIIHGSGAMACP